MKQFTAQEIEDAKFATKLAIQIRQDARIIERKRNLSEADVLSRVPAEEKARFDRGMAIYKAGAYRP